MNASTPIELKDGTQLAGAKTSSGYDLRYYDDCMGPLWVCGEEFGPSWIIRAQSYESAYEIWTDERPTIPQDEVHEAYGFDSDADMLECDRQCREGWREYPDLIEGYTYQSNFSGTGIVATGHCEWLHELTPERLRDIGVSIRIETF
jgi:hypothetical protein